MRLTSVVMMKTWRSRRKVAVNEIAGEPKWIVGRRSRDVAMRKTGVAKMFGVNWEAVITKKFA